MRVAMSTHFVANAAQRPIEHRCHRRRRGSKFGIIIRGNELSAVNPVKKTHRKKQSDHPQVIPNMRLRNGTGTRKETLRQNWLTHDG